MSDADPGPPPSPPTAAPIPPAAWAPRIESAVERALSKWQIHLLILTCLGFLLGWLVYGVSPLHSLKEIARKQEEDRTRGRMVRRHLELAGQFLNVAQWEAARGEFEQALRLDPLSSEAQLGVFKTRVAETLSERQYYDPEVVEKRIDLILKDRKDDPHALAMLGTLYERLDEQQAIAYYQRAIQIEPGLAAAYSGIAIIHDRHHRMGEALEMYEKALSLSKWNRVVLGNLIDLYQQMGDAEPDPERARARYRQVTERGALLMRLDSTLLLAGMTVGQAHLRLGDLEAAGKIYEDLLRLAERREVWERKPNPFNWFSIVGERTIIMNTQPMKLSYLRYQAALCRYLKGRDDEAAAEAKRAADLDPRDRDQIQILIRSEVEKIAARQAGLRAKLERFRADFLAE